MSLQQYYNQCCQPSVWAHPEKKFCACRGSGWFLSDLDTWHKCPEHQPDAPHPEFEEFEPFIGPVQELPAWEPPPACEEYDDDIPF